MSSSPAREKKKSDMKNAMAQRGTGKSSRMDDIMGGLAAGRKKKTK
jgi:hypothetical protein